MDAYTTILFVLLIAILSVLYFSERNRRIESEEDNNRLQDVIRHLDEQAKMIIKTDLALNKVQEELDKKITGLYTLHELGKKIGSTFNIEELFSLINKPLVSKLGFPRGLIMIRDESSGSMLSRASIGWLI